MTTSRTQNEADITRAAALEYNLSISGGVDLIGRPVSTPVQIARQIEAESVARNGFLSLADPNMLPNDMNDRFLYIMKVSSMGYCAGMERDISDWYSDIYWAVFEDAEEDIITYSNYDDDIDWRQHIVSRLYYVWLKIFKGNSAEFDEASGAGRRIAGNERLANLVMDMEKLTPGSEDHANLPADVDIYSNWLKATAAFFDFVDNPTSREKAEEFDECIQIAIDRALRSDPHKELGDTIRWLAAVTRLMIERAA